jgi:hypothetical protein
MSDRLVLVHVTDPEVKEISVLAWRNRDEAADLYSEPRMDEWVPVPEDDQLREDLEAAAAACGHLSRDGHDDWLEWRAIAMRLRACAGLDQEDDHE